MGKQGRQMGIYAVPAPAADSASTFEQALALSGTRPNPPRRRDAAVIAVLLYAGARVEECARLDHDDVAITGRIRLNGKGDDFMEVLAHVTNAEPGRPGAANDR